jgi:hypothetical protein
MSCFTHDEYLDLEAREVDTQAHNIAHETSPIRYQYSGAFEISLNLNPQTKHRTFIIKKFTD